MLVAVVRALLMVLAVKLLKWSGVWDWVCVPLANALLWVPRRAYRLARAITRPCAPCCSWIVHAIGRAWLALFALQAGALIYLWQRDRNYMCPAVKM